MFFFGSLGGFCREGAELNFYGVNVKSIKRFKYLNSIFFLLIKLN